MHTHLVTLPANHHTPQHGYIIPIGTETLQSPNEATCLTSSAVSCGHVEAVRLAVCAGGAGEGSVGALGAVEPGLALSAVQRLHVRASIARTVPACNATNHRMKAGHYSLYLMSAQYTFFHTWCP